MYAITPKERLQQYARYKFETMKAMEVHCGLVNGQIGNSSGLNVSTVQKILEACPELNPDWLILGVGTMERSIPAAKPQPIGVKITNDGLDIVTSQAPVNEPTQPYTPTKRAKDEMVTVPSSILDALRQQLENKDAQIATLLQVINQAK